MMKYVLILVFTFFTSFVLNAQTIDTEKSVVNLKTTALMVNTVRGTFKGMNGTVRFDENDLPGSKFNVCIDPASVYTENQKRDDHLRSQDFLFVENFPKICFVSSSIKKTSKGFETKGKLTIRGVTKEVKIPFTFENNTFTGNLKIKRLDYEVGEDYGNFTASKEAEIEIICVLK